MPVGNNKKGYEAISIKPLHIKQPRLYFNSIITEYSDSWSPNWSPTNVYGRMDPVSTYGGTSRELVLGFRVISDTSAEARENMLKIEKLIQYQYPSYQYAAGGTKIMNSPPYFEFTFLNLLNSTRKQGSKLTGYINGAIQINPGIQSKEQAQFFSPAFDQLYFSDVTITLRMQVLHEGSIGWTNSAFSHKNYPYGIDAGTTAVAAADNQPQPTQPSAPGTPSVSGDTSRGAEDSPKVSERRSPDQSLSVRDPITITEEQRRQAEDRLYATEKQKNLEEKRRGLKQSSIQTPAMTFEELIKIGN